MIVIRDDFDLDDIPYVMWKKSHVIIENGKMTKNRFIGEMPEFAPSICETEDEFIIRVPKMETKMANTHLHDRYRAHQENEKALWKDYYDCCVKEIETILRGHDGEIDISNGDIEWIDRQADRCGHPYMVTLFTEHNFISLQHLTLNQLYLILEELEEKDEFDD